MTEERTAAEVLYRFFCAFSGFDEAHPLGFEAELPPPRTEITGADAGVSGTTAARAFSAVFSMEPTLHRVRRYIHGGCWVRTACTVSVRGSDSDGRQRREMASFFASLADYVTEYGAQYTAGTRVYRITPAAHPARVRLTADGAVWELRCSVEITEV